MYLDKGQFEARGVNDSNYCDVSALNRNIYNEKRGSSIVPAPARRGFHHRKPYGQPDNCPAHAIILSGIVPYPS